ncbi:MAG: hypothetical protein IJJ26_04910 [Victivallales bacterium]|nr:hypothetical protein [Victivallales bacterium]
MNDFSLDNLVLEVSAKAFMDDSEGEMRRVAETMLRQWWYLVAHAKRLSFLLWIGDGSEIYEYSGDLDQKMDWCYLMGLANPREGENTHLVRPDAKPRTYRWLKRLNEILRETAAPTGLPVDIGATLDNGPELGPSPFKFKRHREIANAHSIYPNSFVTCTAVLHADNVHYAAFPNGIPEGTTIGRFLGAQFHEFAKDLGFDYLWLSNGMGFGLETWGLTGGLFDGHSFFPERAPQLRQQLVDFWEEVLHANPDIKLQSRGSNFSAGIEMCTDAAPLPWLYQNDYTTAPVNAPQSAIYFNLGLSIIAWMSHIAELPPN